MVDKRVRYFNGQFLKVEDFQDEQDYHVDRERRPFKALASPGVCEGLEVTKFSATEVTVSAGMAIDSEGRQLVLDTEKTYIIPEDIIAVPGDYILYISYLEQVTEPAVQGTIEERRVDESPDFSCVEANGGPGDSISIPLATLTIADGAISSVSDAREYAGWKLPSENGGGGTLKYQSEEAIAEFDGALTIKGDLQVGEGSGSAGSLALSGDLQVAGSKPIEFKTFHLNVSSTYFTVDFDTRYPSEWHCSIAGCLPNNRALVGLCNSSINISTYINGGSWYVGGSGRLDPSLVGAWSVDVMAIKPNLGFTPSGGDGSYESEDPVTISPFTIPLGDFITLDLLHIPGDTFLMGSPGGEGEEDERPQHLVNVPTFLMGKYPVTREQWEWVVVECDAVSIDDNSMGEVSSLYSSQNGASTYNTPQEDLPVTYVNRWEAVEFCDRLTHHFRDQGLIFRLPTEAEWEYACRAGTTTQYYYGDTVNDSADVNVNCNSSGLDDISTVGSVGTPNHFGLYDMHGNVWEWCIDTYKSDYYADPQSSIGSIYCELAEDDPNRVDQVCRGGSWYNNLSVCRSASRESREQNKHNDKQGFRVVCSAPWL